MSDQAEAYRHLPFDLDVEQAILGALLYDNSHIDVAAAELVEAHFYDPLHGRIFSTIVQRRGDGKITPLTLHAIMKADPGVIETNGQAYFDALRSASPALPDIRYMARILKDLTTRRSLVGIGEALVAGAHEPPHETSSQRLTDEATQALLSLGASGSRPSTKPGEVAVRVLDRAKAALAGERPPSITTGLKRLDKAMGGMQAEDAIFIPGRSGAGKTTLWTNIAVSAARSGHPVLLFSMEMPDFQLTQWMLCNIDNSLRDPHSEKPIEHWKFRHGCLSNFEIQRLDRAKDVLDGLRLEICDDKGLTLAGQMSRSRAFARRYPGELGLIGLDYLQNLEEDSARREENREQVVSRFAKGQKKLAGMLGWPVAATVQLKNKGLTQGPNMKFKDVLPTEEDQRESGAIQMTADINFAVHRAALLHKQAEPTVPHDRDEWITWHDKLKEIETDMWLRGFKNRHGDPGALNIELYADMASASVRDERPGRYHLPSDQPELDDRPF